MNKISKFFSLVCLGLILSISLSACRIPFTEIEIFSKKDKDVKLSDVKEVVDENKPENIIASMVKKMQDVKSHRYKSDIDFKIFADFEQMMMPSFDMEEEEEAKEIDPIIVSYSDEGAFVKLNEDEINMSHDVKLEWDQGDMIMKAGLNFKEVDGREYFQVTIMPTLLKIVLGDEMEGQWFQVDEKEEGEEETINPMIPDFSMISGEDEEFNKLKDELTVYLEENNPFVFKEELAQADINGVNTHHYKVELDNDFINGLENIIIEFAKEQIEKEVKEDEEFYAEMGIDIPTTTDMTLEEQIKEMEDIINQFDSIFVKKDMELWIGQEDLLLYKTSFDMVIDASKITPPEGEEKAEIKLEITGDMSAYDFNEDIKIEAPEESQSLEEYLGEKMGSILGGSMMIDDETMVDDIDTDDDGVYDSAEELLGLDPEDSDTDGDGLLDGEEMYTYYTDPLEADSDGDGYSDGNEVKGGYNPNGDGELNMDESLKLELK